MGHFSITIILSLAAVASSISSDQFMQKLNDWQMLSAQEEADTFSNEALQEADAWLRAHEDDPGDEAGMAELKATNPEAYAVVNALLTKKSLGLLNSRHHPLDMADSQMNSPQTETQAAYQAPAVVPEAPAVAVPAAPEEVDPIPPVSGHHDFLNWKPANDEEMVSNVLGMVAGLTNGKSVPHASAAAAAPVKKIQAEDLPTQPQPQPETLPDVQAAEAPAQPQFQPEAQVQPKAQPQSKPQHRASALSFDWGNTYAGFQSKHENAETASSSPLQKAPPQQDLSNNPYLKGIDFSSELPQSTISQVAENSYLKSVNLNGGDTPQPQKKKDVTADDIGGPNKLTKFNWYN